MPINAGDLRYRVDLMRLLPSTDTDGETVLGGPIMNPRPDADRNGGSAVVGEPSNVQLLRRVSAEIRGDGGSMFFQSQQVRAEGSHTIRIRFYPELRPGDQIWHQSNNPAIPGGTRRRVFHVVAAADPDGRRTETRCLCTEAQ